MARREPDEDATRGKDASVQELLDKRAIRDVLLRHSRGVDRLDAELLRSAFFDDARVSSSSDLAEGEGGISDLSKDDDAARSLHYVTNEFIELDGDEATCESYWHEVHVTFGDKASEVTHTFGRYIDRFERRAGEWRMVRRALVAESNQIESVTAPRPADRRTVPLRSRADVSYSREIQ